MMTRQEMHLSTPGPLRRATPHGLAQKRENGSASKPRFHKKGCPAGSFVSSVSFDLAMVQWLGDECRADNRKSIPHFRKILS